MTRQKYHGSIQVRSQSRGITYLWKWNGRKYILQSIVDSQDANILGLPEVDFRISDKDLESLEESS